MMFELLLDVMDRFLNREISQQALAKYNYSEIR